MDELRKGIAIGMLFGSGGEGHGNLMTKTATENGTYTAAEEIDPETGEIFDPPKDGYSVFTVDLPLDDKSVSFTTSQIIGSQTAEFEYDPHDENPELEGYSLFTIDLSGVKDDIEDLQQQIADAEACRQQVISVLQQYDPDYDPAEGECPASEVEDLYDDWVADEEKIADLQEQLDDCHDCKDEVVTAIQQYDPDYDPDPDECPAPKIPEIVEDNKGYEFPPKPDGTLQDPDVIIPLIATDPLEDTSSRYAPTFYAALENIDTHEVTKSNVYAGAFRTAETGRWSGSLGIDIYDKTTKQTVYSSISALSVGGYGLNSVDSGVGLNTMSIDPTTGVISVTFTWYHVWDTRVRDYVDYQYSKTITGLETYFTGYGTGTWKVKNT